MRANARKWLVALVIACAGGAADGQQAPAASKPQLSEKEQLAQLDRWIATLNNWGRWGKDDELGTINLITPAKRAQAAALIKTGITVSTAHEAIIGEADDVRTPFVFKMLSLGADKWGEFAYHDFASAHIDSLCHGSYNGKLYNDRVQKDVVTMEKGCSELGIENLKNGIVTRGILIDAPRLKGVPYLEPGTRLFREDAEAFEKKTGIKIAAGDVLLLRVGRWARRAKGLPYGTGAGSQPRSGWDLSFLPFLKERDIAAIGSDEINDFQLRHGILGGIISTPVHHFGIVALGMPVMDALDLEELADTAAKLNRWEFFFTVSPIPVPNGTGSPINPIAVF